MEAVARYLLPEVVVAGGILLLLLAGAVRPRSRSGWSAVIALGSCILALFVLVRAPVLAPAGQLLAPGALPWLLRVTMLFAATLIIFMSPDYLDRYRIPGTDYHALLLLSVLGMLMTVVAGHLLLFFLGVELTGLAGYVLVGMVPGSPRSKNAALTYLIFGLLASGIMLFGMALLFNLTGSWAMDAAAATGRAGLLSLVLILLGLAFKLGLVPGHLWVPDVYVGAPAPVTAFLAVGPKIAVLGAAMVIFLGIFARDAAVWEKLWWALAACSMTWGNLAALAQKNLKRMLAYSSIAHMGYLAMALAAAGNRPAEGVSSLVFYLFTYVFFNTGIFVLVSWLDGPRHAGPDLSDLVGFGRRHPWSGAGCTLSLLALAGLPPTSGFMAKFWVFLAAVRSGFTGLVTLAVLNSLIGAWYYLRVVLILYRSDGPEGKTDAVPGFGALVLGLSALTILWFGLFPGQLLDIIRLSLGP